MRSEVAISVRNLTKNYRIFRHPGDRIKQALSFGQATFHHSFTGLQDISFEVRKGETVGIIGRNGSGKSTLLQLVCGILKPSSGSISVSGRVAALLELGAGFNPEFTGRENVYFQGAILGIPASEIDKRIDDIATFADIGEFIDQPVRTYSSGMFVRLAFSAAIHIEPDILVVDEALSVGDAVFQQRCTRRMKELSDGGVTILFVSHDLHLVERFCDRVLVLDKGRSVCDASAVEASVFYQNLIEQQAADNAQNASGDAEGIHGTEEVTLTNLRLLGRDNRERTDFATGDDIVVEMRYAVRTPVKNVYFACSVWTTDGIRVGTASMIFNDAIPVTDTLDREFTAKMILLDLPLLPGSYMLRGGVYDEHLHHAHCLWGWNGKPLGQFTVLASNRNGFALKGSLGLVLLPSQWQVCER
jgi:ABC-type polysaccharide/polyol phosphate transport system ATPase subunit